MVPAVHDIPGDLKLAVESIIVAVTEEEVRYGPVEKQASRIIEVVLALDDYGSSWSHEFPDVDLQPLADRGHVLQVTFLKVLIEAQFGGTRGVHHIHCLPQTERHVAAEAAGVIHRLIRDPLPHVHAELVCVCV